MENKPLFKNSLEKGYADHGETLTNLLASIAFEQNVATFYDTAVGVADLPLSRERPTSSARNPGADRPQRGSHTRSDRAPPFPAFSFIFYPLEDSL